MGGDNTCCRAPAGALVGAWWDLPDRVELREYLGEGSSVELGGQNWISGLGYRLRVSGIMSLLSGYSCVR
jgi:hypothetical protein